MPIRIANAPVSWGIYEFEGAAQKYNYERVLDEIKATGYDGLELGPWGFLPTDEASLNAELQGLNMSLLSAFVPVKLVDPATHDEALEHAIKVGRLLAACGAHYLVLADDNGTVPELVQKAGQRTGSALDSSQWKVVCAGVDRIAKTLRDQLGLQTVFHHHCAGYVETPEETRRLIEGTDPELVGLCLDTGHYHYAGGDAVQCIKDLGERVRYLHLKDCDPAVRKACIRDGADYFEATARGVFCELGKGEVDFPGVLAAMEALGYDGWAIVEQDVLVDDLDAPRESAARNREYLRSLGY